MKQTIMDRNKKIINNFEKLYTCEYYTSFNYALVWCKKMKRYVNVFLSTRVKYLAFCLQYIFNLPNTYTSFKISLEIRAEGPKLDLTIFKTSEVLFWVEFSIYFQVYIQFWCKSAKWLLPESKINQKGFDSYPSMLYCKKYCSLARAHNYWCHPCKSGLQSVQISLFWHIGQKKPLEKQRVLPFIVQRAKACWEI